MTGGTSAIVDTPKQRKRWIFLRDVPLLQITAIFGATRVALFLLIGYTIVATTPNQSLHHAILSNLCRFDCNWFMSIASHGYSTIEDANQPGATNFAFYPLFPLLLRGALWAGPNTALVAVVLNNALLFCALVLIYKYVRLVGGERSVALTTIALICTLPQTLTFSVPYADSLFLLLLVGACYAMRRQHFLVAGICAALLTATRANGIFFMLFACIWIWRRFGWDSLLRPWRIAEAYVPVVLAPLGLFVFWGFCFAAVGDAFAYGSTEFHGWGWRFDDPLTGLLTGLHAGGLRMFSAAISLAVFALSLRLLKFGLMEDAAFCIGCVLLIWSSQNGGSVFRYWLLTFPVWYAAARALEGRPITTAITFSLISTVNGALTCAWALQNISGI